MDLERLQLDSKLLRFGDTIWCPKTVPASVLGFFGGVTVARLCDSKVWIAGGTICEG